MCINTYQESLVYLQKFGLFIEYFYVNLFNCFISNFNSFVYINSCYFSLKEIYKNFYTNKISL